jgi:hypothetical protein
VLDEALDRSSLSNPSSEQNGLQSKEMNKIYSRVVFSIYVHKNEFSFLNRILVVSAQLASISEIPIRTSCNG